MAIIFSKRVIFSSLIIAGLYIIFSIYLMNLNLVITTLLGSYAVRYKLNLLYALLGGMWSAMPHSSFILLVIAGLLSGINISLLAKRISSLGGIKNTDIMVGGSSILGIVGSGCAACGLPLISLLGLSGVLLYLPFHGSEFAYVSIPLLVFSLYMLLKENKKTNSCEIVRNHS
ncbi:MAG: hypothetical protein ABIO02_01905 [Patescibacteria group bacterium]